MRAMSPPSLGSSSTLLSQPRFSDESGPAMKKARSSHNVENAGVAPTQGSKARMNPAVVTDVFSSRANQAPARGASKGAESPYPARRSTRLRNNTASAVAKQTNLKVKSKCLSRICHSFSRGPESLMRCLLTSIHHRHANGAVARDGLARGRSARMTTC